MACELVRLGAEVDLLGSDGMTPLHYACRFNFCLPFFDLAPHLVPTYFVHSAFQHSVLSRKSCVQLYELLLL